ncbi:MAG: galactosyldiacylglycerol synthase [Acidipila sp.]|nr:galactosyldiacylglycerol synthase [Acidipila sp.]
MKRLDLVYFDAGGGHRAAATALAMVIEKQVRPWEIRPVNLQDVLAPLDLIRKLTGVPTEDFYNGMLKSGATLGSGAALKILHAITRGLHSSGVGLLEKYWRAREPDMVVSLVPNMNRVLGESFARAYPGRPYVTILTDLADYPPHFWMERQPQYFICGTQRAVEQAHALGHDQGHVFRTSGMILHPRFYEAVIADRAVERQRLGLGAERPTALVLFGGHGSRVMKTIVERLDRSGLDLQLILICGRNAKLARTLREKKIRMPIFVEGFTKEIPYFMHLADFFIGKPGPGSLSEAIAMRLPVIVECNAWTLVQERFNAAWVREQQIGIVLKNFRGIAAAVEESLRPGVLARFRENEARLENRAVFEIPEILEKILSAPT